MEPGTRRKQRESAAPSSSNAVSRDQGPRSQYWLFFNAYGEIGYCSDSLAHLLGSDMAEVQGKSITAILCGLPVSRDTPGSNIGVLMMNYVGRRVPLELGSKDGVLQPVYATFRSIHIGSGPAFIVELELDEIRGKGRAAGRSTSR